MTTSLMLTITVSQIDNGYLIQGKAARAQKMTTMAVSKSTEIPDAGAGVVKRTGRSGKPTGYPFPIASSDDL